MGCDGEIDDMLRIRLREAGSDEEIFTSVPWIRAFNINEPIYAELCHEFYSTYEFDEVYADDELQSKKIIKFRLGRRAHSLTLLEFARSDDNFNAQDNWLSISREDNLGLSRSHTSTIKNLILRVIHKMITYGLYQRKTGYDKIQKNDLWLLSMFNARHQNGYANVAWVIARWMKRKGAGTQKESQICCGQFISKIARKCRVLTEDVVRSLSALIYCRDLDIITLRDLIDFDGKLILEDPQPGVPRFGIPRPSRASMQDLYDRMGRMEICQEAIERMEYRQEPTTHLVTAYPKYERKASFPQDKGSEDEGPDLDDECHGLEDKGPGSEEEEAAPTGQQQAVLVVDTIVDEPLGLGYGALRRRELALGEGLVPNTFKVGQSSESMPEQEGAERIYAFRQPTLVTWVDPEDGRVYTDILTYVPPAAPIQTPPSLEWSSGSLPVSPSSLVLELHRSILYDHTQLLDALPPTLFEDYDRDLRELYTRSGAVRDEIFSENHDLRRQIAKERRKRLELTDRVARIERR
ncbi:hypothetical protein Tco_0680694 [Tanacetum coccineum]|uniref:Uncharacterized protein n=1 Tax=Tanacetum coccineum TaxID=301880 RepID=A0ABQ4XMN5_9ASTR